MKEEEKLILALKRMVNIIATGKNRPYQYGNITLYRAEVHILEMIGKQNGITASDIVNNIGVTKGAISQIISKLFKKRLIHRTTKADNIKIHELHLTKKGMQVLSFHNEYEKELMKKILPELRKLSTETISSFTSIVNSVIDFTKE
jgi:DNA-binding MarR family transcriptional regulator